MADEQAVRPDPDVPTPAEAATQALADIAAVWASWTSDRLTTDDAMAAIRDHLTTAREQGAL